MTSASDPSLHLRPGTARDVDACVELWVAACTARDRCSSDGVAERTRAKFCHGVAWLVVDNGEQIAGFALTTAPGSGRPTDPEDAAVIGLLATHPRCQAQGLGRTLLRAITSELADAGHARAVLHSLLDNTAANALYEGEGWTPTGEEFEHSLLERPCRTLIRDLADI